MTVNSMQLTAIDKLIFHTNQSINSTKPSSHRIIFPIWLYSSILQRNSTE